MECEERDRLLDALTKAVDAFFAAATDLQSKTGVPFHKALIISTAAREKCTRARIALQHHREEHHCCLERRSSMECAEKKRLFDAYSVTISALRQSIEEVRLKTGADFQKALAALVAARDVSPPMISKPCPCRVAPCGSMQPDAAGRSPCRSAR